MLIGILSDIHDNLEALRQALDEFRKRKVETVVFCGDLCAPFSAKMLAACGLPVHAVFGNNDGDRYLITKNTAEFPDFKLYGEFIGDEDCLLVLDGCRIGVTHYPFYAKTMAKTGWYDCVFYGHNHKADKQKFGNCLMLNPGDVAGISGKRSVAVYDTQLKSSEIIFF